jgi:hypothetical protein
MFRIRRITRIAATAGAGATALLAAAATAAGPPTITFLITGQQANTVTVRITTQNFTIDANGVGKKARHGRGHEHFVMDGGKFDRPKYSGANGRFSRGLGVRGKYSGSVDNTVTYTGLPKGKHTVKVLLVRNTHARYPNAGAEKTLTFTVR